MINAKCDVFARLSNRKRVLLGTLTRRKDEEWNYPIIKQLVDVEIQFRNSKEQK